jgi:tRNA(Ile)-lysidine synthase
VIERMIRIIERARMFASGMGVGVAVSGGADSVCLLHALLDLRPRWGLRLSVLHLNHRLRGAESDRDEEFVREMAARAGVPILVKSWDRREADSSNLEEAARDARLAFFAEVMASGAVDRVAVGHTRRDQAETVLFRFLRGAGTAGLAGIRPVTSTGIVRPLIGIDRDEVEAFLRERGIAWREDSSNLSPEFARNRIRHQLLPQLARDWNPAIGETLASTADWALAEEAYWEAEIDRLASERFRESGGAVVLRADALLALPLAVGRRLARRAMERVKGDLRGIDFGHIEKLLDLAAGQGHGRFQAPGLDIFRSFDWLRVSRPGLDTLENRNYSFPAPVPGRVALPGPDSAILLELIESTGTSGSFESVYNSGVSSLDADSINGALEVRNWRPGDRIQPIGKAGEEKIKTLFQEERIPLWERRHWPVVVCGASIVWTRRFGPDARFLAGPGARRALAIGETGGCPEFPGNRDRAGRRL